MSAGRLIFARGYGSLERSLWMIREGELETGTEVVTRLVGKPGPRMRAANGFSFRDWRGADGKVYRVFEADWSATAREDGYA